MDPGTYARSTSSTIRRRIQEGDTTAEIRFFLGLKLADEGDPSGAAAALESAIAIKPDFVDAAYRLGLILFDNGEFSRAKKALEQMIDLTPYNGQRAEMLGQIYMTLNAPRSACEYFLEAIRERGTISFVAHLGLTELMTQGSNPYFAAKQRPFDERIRLERGAGSFVLCRLRIFHDLLQHGHKVVLLTTEAENRDPGDCGVSNGAETLISHVLANAAYEIDVNRSTWVTMHEKSVHGTAPMRISQLHFHARPASSDPIGWSWLRWRKQPRASALAPTIEKLEFRSIEHDALEKMIGYRLYWKG